MSENVNQIGNAVVMFVMGGLGVISFILGMLSLTNTIFTFDMVGTIIFFITSVLAFLGVYIIFWGEGC